MVDNRKHDASHQRRVDGLEMALDITGDHADQQCFDGDRTCSGRPTCSTTPSQVEPFAWRKNGVEWTGVCMLHHRHCLIALPVGSPRLIAPFRKAGDRIGQHRFGLAMTQAHNAARHALALPQGR